MSNRQLLLTAIQVSRMQRQIAGHILRSQQNTTMMGSLALHINRLAVVHAQLLCVERERRVWRWNTHSSFWEETVSSWPDDKFMSVFRMSRVSFLLLLDIVSPKIVRQLTHLRKPVPAAKRLAIALAYFASGSPLAILAHNFSCGLSTVREIIIEVSDAIQNSFTVDGFPTSPNEFQKLALDFQNIGRFPGCVGCIDGSHIPISKPYIHGAEYYCYKKFYSIVLLAVCDANKTIRMFSAGFPGKCNDAGVFDESGMVNKVKEITEVTGDLNYHVLGDIAFPLMVQLMKPYTQSEALADQQKRCYNYELSKVRMLIEQTFGLLKMRLRCLVTPLTFRSIVVNTGILACCVHLHNFLIKVNDVTEILSDEEYEQLLVQYPQPETASYENEGVSSQANMKRRYLTTYINSLP